MKQEFGSDYASIGDVDFTAKYRASCYCNTVQYEARADPVDAKICHCLACQKLHGAPMQWAAIFHKHDIRITRGVEHLKFYNSEINKHERILPCKVSCALCGTLIADEGRNMWLAFPTLFEFGGASDIPITFKPSCHIFYGMRVVDVNDDLPKWSGHKDKSLKFDWLKCSTSIVSCGIPAAPALLEEGYFAGRDNHTVFKATFTVYGNDDIEITCSLVCSFWSFLRSLH